jgi:uncharacterized membrane protein YtjA (UPF0391 family)
MIDWIIATLFGTFVFALLGFTSVARGFASIAKVMFYIFAIGFCVALIISLI